MASATSVWPAARRARPPAPGWPAASSGREPGRRPWRCARCTACSRCVEQGVEVVDERLDFARVFAVDAPVAAPRAAPARRDRRLSTGAEPAAHLQHARDHAEHGGQQRSSGACSSACTLKLRPAPAGAVRSACVNRALARRIIPIVQRTTPTRMRRRSDGVTARPGSRGRARSR